MRAGTGTQNPEPWILNLEPIHCMKWKIFILFPVLLACFSVGYAQQACNLVLMPEGDNLCMLEGNACDFSVTRACRGNKVSYRVNSPSAIRHVWSVAGGTFQLSGDSTECRVTWGNGSSGTVTVEALMPDSTICTGQIQVLLEDRPVAGVITTPSYIVDVGDPEVKWIEACVGDTLSFVDNSTSADRPIVDYYWEYPCGVSDNRSISFEARDSGNYDIVHRVYNECGCYDEVRIGLVVREECPLRLSCFGTVCADSRHTYSVRTPSCSDYLWNVQGGTIVSPQHVPDVTVQWDAPGSGFGMLNLDGDSCDCECESRKGIRIPVISDNAGISGPDTLCLNGQYTFTVPLWGATRYSWSVSPSTGIAMTEDNNRMTLTPLQNQSYTISVTYSCDFLGCGPYTITKDVHVKSPLNIIPGSVDREVCIGTVLTFSTDTAAECHWTVELNDSIVHTVTADSLEYNFDTCGTFTVRARNNGCCDEASVTVNVKDTPPPPAMISGPDTVCPHFAAEYSATPGSPDCYILWEWTAYGTTYAHPGDRASITFGYPVGDISVCQVDRRTGCRSDTATYHVSPFRLADWPYGDILRVCPGQSITLNGLRNQSGDGVLYEWKAVPADALSIQGSHLGADVTLKANHISSLPTTVRLILKRTYCHTSRYDTAYVRVGEAAPPSIMHGPVCMGNHTLFSMSDTGDAAPDATYWWTDADTGSRVYGVQALLAFNTTNTHVVHLHYVSGYGCTAEACDTVTVCPRLPDMAVVADSAGGTLSVVIDGDTTGYTYRWMDGSTAASIVAPPDAYRCTVTAPDCGCTRTLSHGQDDSGCTHVDSAFRIDTHCCNIISIGGFTRQGLHYPVTAYLLQGDCCRIHTLADSTQRMLVPDTNRYSVRITWSSGDTCYYSTMTDTVRNAVALQMSNDCHGNLAVSGRYANGASASFSVRVTNAITGAVIGPTNAAGAATIPITAAGWYNVRIGLGDSADCYFDTLLHFDARPAIQNINVSRTMCENTAFTFQADATGEGLTYKWDFGDGSWNFGNGIDHVYDGPGGFGITLTVTDRNGCSVRNTIPITVIRDYLKTYTMDSVYYPICPGASAIIQTRHDSNNIYVWSPCHQFTGHQAHVFATGTYMVDITSVQEQCRQQLALNVPYPNGPLAAILCDSTYCQGEVAELIGFVGADYTYQWNILSANKIDSATTPDLDYHLVDTGTHQVILWVTDSNGCASSDTAYFHVQPTPPAPALQFCGNQCITNGPVELCSTTGRSLLWSNGTSGTSTRFFTDGPAGAYYIDTATGCKSGGATISIPKAPDFGGLLTGCYCISKNSMPAHLPLYTLGNRDTLSWEWFRDNNPSSNGSLPPSPGMLDIPESGEYQLVIPDYGLGCRAVSPRLVIETDGCTPQAGAGTTPSVYGGVTKKECVQTGCMLKYLVAARICNGTDSPVCIDDIYTLSSIAYSIASGIPVTLNPGECQEILLAIQYDCSLPSSFVFVMTCNGAYMGNFVVDFSDWMDCVQPDTCKIGITHAFNLDGTLSRPGQSAFFKFGLTFPSPSVNVISVRCDQGQIIDGHYADSTYSGLLMLDYGLLTQLVVDSADFCFHIVCCDSGRICICEVSVPYWDFWEMCRRLEPKGQPGTDDGRTEVEEKSFALVPNPATGLVKVVNRNPRGSDGITRIAVFSMNGQEMLSVGCADSFDASALASGSYIVKVVTEAGRHEYLKLIKAK